MQVYATIGMDSSSISCKQLVSSLHLAFLKTGTGVDTEIGTGVNQEAHLCKSIRHIEAAG